MGSRWWCPLSAKVETIAMTMLRQNLFPLFQTLIPLKGYICIETNLVILFRTKWVFISGGCNDIIFIKKTRKNCLGNVYCSLSTSMYNRIHSPPITPRSNCRLLQYQNCCLLTLASKRPTAVRYLTGNARVYLS